MTVEVSDGKINYQDDDSHPANEFLVSPNPYNTIGDIKVHEVESLMLAGNGYLGFDNFVNGIPTEFYPLEPWRTRIRPNAKGMPDGFEYFIDPSKTVSYKYTEICHSKVYNVNDPFYGRSRIEPVHSELLLDHYVKRYNKNFFKNDATPSGMIFPNDPGGVDFEQIKAWTQKWEERYRGVENSHKFGIFPVDGKFESFSPPLKDMAFLELLKFDREQILAVLGAPPALVGVYEYANYANSDIQKQLFWENAVLPIITLIEEALNQQIMYRFYDRDHVYKFDLSGVQALQEDEKIRAETDAILVRSNIMTVNEVRAERNLEAVEWGDEPVLNNLSGLLPGAGDGQQDNTDGTADNGKVGVAAPAIRKKVVSLAQSFWKSHDGYLIPNEKRFLAVFKPFVRQQKQRVLDNLDRVTNKGLTSFNLLWVIKAMDMHLQGKDNPDYPEEANRIFNLEAEDIGYAEVSIPMFQRSLIESGNDVMDYFSIDFNLSVNNPEVKVAIQQFYNRSKLFNKTTYRKIQDILREGYEAGSSINEIKKQINQTYTFLTSSRAEMIAQTEMNGVINRGRRLAYKGAGISKHEWIATFDSKVRDTHIYTNGEVVEIGKPFTKLSAPLVEPGDPSGPAHEVINCRCTTMPVLDGE